MSLTELFCRKVVDRLMCPSEMITSEGEDAYAKNEFIRILNRPEVTTPLLTSASAIAISVAIQQPLVETAIFALENIGGIAAMNLWIIGAEKRDEMLEGEATYKSPEYYVDRTKKQWGTSSPEVNSDLLLKEQNAMGYLGRTFAISAVLTTLNPTMVLPASVFAIKGFAYYWQNKRTIEGEWRVNETLPTKEAKKSTKILPDLKPA